ncbi:hypothetical protein BASA60_001644 [Batrachochytrium salamandrivorans]|nr:hypothetical protein BASA60_001644 [Batrachochytrium salamandrivorans]
MIASFVLLSISLVILDSPGSASWPLHLPLYRVMDRDWEASRERKIIGDESLGKYTKAPRLRLQKIENMNKALDFIKKRGVTLTNIGSEDIVDSNSRSFLSDLDIIWRSRSTYRLGRVTRCIYKRCVDKINLRDRSSCGLIHRHRQKQKSANTQLAFDIAERHLGIPKYLLWRIVDVIKPDERSVMTYVAQYSMLFCSWMYSISYALDLAIYSLLLILGKLAFTSLYLDNIGFAGRRVGQLGQVRQQAWEMQNEYERRVSERFALLNEFETYKGTPNADGLTERRRDLDGLTGNIQTTSVTP